MPKKKAKKEIPSDPIDENEQQTEQIETTGEFLSLTLITSRFCFCSSPPKGSVTNSGGHLTSVNFDSLSESNVSESTLKAIKEMNLTTMTEIQAKSIGPLLEGRCVDLFPSIIFSFPLLFSSEIFSLQQRPDQEKHWHFSFLSLN